ncbi:hypothetical protein [Dongia sp.]|uniref:hypothetical protein n=1 Tax=Dongia sp. TaxID=1977262 RepID=UPI0035B09E49
MMASFCRPKAGIAKIGANDDRNGAQIAQLLGQGGYSEADLGFRGNGRKSWSLRGELRIINWFKREIMKFSEPSAPGQASV